MDQDSALSSLRSYSSELLRCSTLDAVFDLAVRTSRRQLASRNAAFFRFSKSGQLVRAHMEGLPAEFPPETYRRGQGLVGRTAGTPDRFGESYLSPDVNDDPHIQQDPVVRQYLENYNSAIRASGCQELARTVLTVPFNGLYRTFGVLRLIDKVDPATGRALPEPFTEADRDWLILLAHLTAMAAVNMKRRYELSTLAKTLQLLGEENEKVFLDRVAKTLTDQNSVYSICLIHAFNRKLDKLKIFSHSDNFRRVPGMEKKDVLILPGKGVAGRVFVSGKYEIVQDLDKQPKGFLVPEWVKHNGLVSLICLPLKNRRGGPNFGTLQLFTQYNYTFDPDNIQYLESVANQISTVLRTLQEKKDLHRINKLVEDLNEETTTAGVLRASVRKLPPILAFDRALSLVAVPGSRSFAVVASTSERQAGRVIDGSEAVVARLSGETRVRAFRSLHPERLSPDLRQLLEGAESLVIAPITAKGQLVLGAILLINDRRGDSPTGRLKEFRRGLCQTVANQISGSIRKDELLASLDLESKRQLALQRVLRQTSATEQEGSAAILDSAIKELMQVLKVDGALLGLLTKDSEGFAPYAAHGLAGEEPAETQQGAIRALARLTVERKSSLWPPASGRSTVKIFRQRDIRSEVASLLIFREQPIGLLAVGSRQERGFDEAAVSFIETFVSGLAARVQNSVFFQGAIELGTVRFDEISVKPICDILARKTCAIVGTPLACVWLRRKQGEDEILDLRGVHGAEIRDRSAFAMKRSTGSLSWDWISEAESRLEDGKGGPLHRVYDDIQIPGSRFSHPEFARAHGLKSVIIMPLIHEKRILGVINTYSRRRYQFFDFEVYLLRNLALSGAMALVNAELADHVNEINESILEKAQLANPGTLALSFSHDIGHTLSDVNAMLSILIEMVPKRLQEEDPGKNLIQSLTTSTDHLRKLFHRFVKYAAKAVKYESTSLKEVFQSVEDIYHAALLRNRIEFAKPKIEGGDIRIDCDRSQIEQVLVNLINNSIFAIRGKMSKGGQISISARKLSEEGEYVEIQFRDNGVGVPPEDVERIFDPFFTTKGSKGSGFGLPICRKIVEDNHHGKIWLQSKQHESATVFIKLPQRQQ